MTLIIGACLGPYEIRSLLGVGGMGEVYRARDTKLDRDVAIKILPESFVSDPERVARFQREAKTLASLNHPNIGGLYGLEGEGRVTALVMELVEGEDLSEWISRGAIPVAEALPIAGQIAEALASAHEQGIIHRDLKPANIKVRPDGTVKVLDFGLAKPIGPVGSAPDLGQSPTITTPAMMTDVGVILGTAAYMAPEQAKGKTVDKRADIWAFGAVLFEMLTGKRPFHGEDVGDTLAAVLRAEPDWTALPAEVPSSVRALLRACLEKNLRQRIADIAAVLFVLRHHATGAGLEAHPRAGYGDVRHAVLLSTAALLIGGVLAGWGVWLLTRPAPPPVVRAAITTAGSTALTLSGIDRDIAITPDGTRVVYRGNNQVLVRELNRLEPTVLSGLGAPQGLFISPDGQSVGFFDGRATIKRVPITGGPPVFVCRSGLGQPSGATWGSDGTIIFATNAPGIGLHRVSADGGEPVVLTKPNRALGEYAHVWPEFLPNGKAVLFTINPTSGMGSHNAQIAVLDLRTGTSKILIRGGSHAHYVPTGHLVYGAAEALRAVPFDAERLAVVGTSAPVLQGVMMTELGAVQVAVSANGSLAYLPSETGGAGLQTVVLVDRQGRASPVPGIPAGSYRSVRVSPDRGRLAVATTTDVWTYDFVRATLSRLTSDGRSPLWTPDGQRMIFASNRAGYPQLFWRPADGTGSDERLLDPGKELLDILADGWSPDGRQLLFSQVPPNLQCLIGQFAVDHPADVRVLVNNGACSYFAAVSPDARWMAYTSQFSGREEIYVERYPGLGNRQQISTGGGRLPLWSRDGRELFFTSLDNRQLFAAAMHAGTTLVADRPQVLFELAMFSGLGTRHYDVAPDGRFVVIQKSATTEAGVHTAPNVILVLNWFAELKRLMPVN